MSDVSLLEDEVQIFAEFIIQLVDNYARKSDSQAFTLKRTGPLSSHADRSREAKIQ